MPLIPYLFFVIAVHAEPTASAFCADFRNCKVRIKTESTQCLNAAIRESELVKRVLESAVASKVAADLRQEGWQEASEPLDEGSVRLFSPGPGCGGNAGLAQVYCAGRWIGANDPGSNCESITLIHPGFVSAKTKKDLLCRIFPACSASAGRSYECLKESFNMSGLTTRRLEGNRPKDAPRFLLKENFDEVTDPNPRPEGTVRVFSAECAKPEGAVQIYCDGNWLGPVVKNENCATRDFVHPLLRDPKARPAIQSPTDVSR